MKTKWINAVLHNDETSTDEELKQYFKDNGLTEKEIDYYIGFRNVCLNNSHFTCQY